MRTLAQPHGKDRGASYSRWMKEQATYQTPASAVGESLRVLLSNLSDLRRTTRNGLGAQPTFVWSWQGPGDNAVDLARPKVETGRCPAPGMGRNRGVPGSSRTRVDKIVG